MRNTFCPCATHLSILSIFTGEEENPGEKPSWHEKDHNIRNKLSSVMTSVDPGI